MRLRPDTRHVPGATGTATRPQARRTAASTLARLLERAAIADLHDPGGAAGLRDAARSTLTAIVADGGLPSHLVVAAGDAPVVVQRTLLTAWHHLDRADRVGAAA